MPEGFVIVARENEDSNLVISVWDGYELQPDLTRALFITDRSTARAVYGAVQSQFSEQEISMERAITTVAFIDTGLVLAPPNPEFEPATNLAKTRTGVISS